MTGYTKKIICLANSRKLSGHCVAGRELASGVVGDWVRPTSARTATGELSNQEEAYQSGGAPALLDVITIPMLRPAPHSFQSENHLIDATKWWEHRGQATASEVVDCLEQVSGALWGTDSTYHGINDKVDEAIANGMDHSLKFVEVADLTIHVAMEGGRFKPAELKVRGHFTLNKIPYLLSVTDPVIEASYLPRSQGKYSVGRAGLCISLSEIAFGAAYKLIAGVILPPKI